MPTGRVKWFDADKGFGFVTADDGEQVFLHSTALPDGAEIKQGTRLDFDMIDGRKGKQVLKARLIEPPVAKRARRDPDKTAMMIEDVIRLLDDTSNGLRRGRYPDSGHSHKVAEVLRAIADDLEG
ncbi:MULTISPECIES: cold-shock protein [Brevibacterium]|uniref:Cold shock domain-containing protein n=1 Tax=Brevibacterium pityocampae TaxID=506594 RepID=A0ABP8J4E4_9MICO|nr:MULTISPECIES: cold shock domain-containing protein [Actinomycetes]MCK1801686.1 cold shock domain-containing protein [Brevibacterium sp. R8603A2]MCX0275974.1 cold shock domain-containing protein [Nocardia zapadnayensis]QCP04954.1 cold shock domain-containing protein [Brevibacterium sp. CS2]